MSNSSGIEDIEALIASGRYDEARVALSHVEHPHKALLYIKLSFLDGSVTPPITMNALIHYMKQRGATPEARKLYEEASKQALSGHSSSIAHSHPPPPLYKS